MGMHEYDRIRHKNRLYDEAYNMYLELQTQGLDDKEITSLCKSHMEHFSADARNDVYSAILRIAGRSDAQVSDVSSNNDGDNSDAEKRTL